MGRIIDNVIYSVNDIVKTKRNRHILGGILLSLSALLSGLAITIMTIKEDNNYEECD